MHFLKFTEWSLSTQTKKMAGKRLFWWLMLFLFIYLFTCCSCSNFSVLWLLLWLLMMQSLRQKQLVELALIWCNTNPTQARRGYPTLKPSKIWSRLRGLLGLADRAIVLCGSPAYHRSVIKLKWEIPWTGGLPHISGLPHQPRGSTPVNRPQGFEAAVHR